MPFTFASDYGEYKATDEAHIAELIVSKPYDRDYLSVAISNALTKNQRGAVSNVAEPA